MSKIPMQSRSDQLKANARPFQAVGTGSLAEGRKPLPELTMESLPHTAWINRFWSFVQKESKPRSPHVDTPCWIWNGATIFYKKSGFRYGRIAIGPHKKFKSYLVHRLSFLIFNKAVPEGCLVRHKCDMPLCVNPDHLESGSYCDNAKDTVDHGHYPKGEQTFNSKLTDNSVRDMRLRHKTGETMRSLGIEYGVSQVAARLAIIGKTWRHVK